MPSLSSFERVKLIMRYVYTHDLPHTYETLGRALGIPGSSVRKTISTDYPLSFERDVDTGLIKLTDPISWPDGRQFDLGQVIEMDEIGPEPPRPLESRDQVLIEAFKTIREMAQVKPDKRPNRFERRQAGYTNQPRSKQPYTIPTEEDNERVKKLPVEALKPLELLEQGIGKRLKGEPNCVDDVRSLTRMLEWSLHLADTVKSAREYNEAIQTWREGFKSAAPEPASDTAD